MQHECKITVLETKCFPDLQEQYLAAHKEHSRGCIYRLKQVRVD